MDAQLTPPALHFLRLLAAFADRECILAAYTAAVAADYRLYSYGDAMLAEWR